MIITNILDFLHTSAAYQAAALQLMVNEANFVAKQLELNETVPPAAAVAGAWGVDRPTDGVGGTVYSANYEFTFHAGTLRSVRKERWFQKVSPSIASVLDLADRTSLLDTNSAYKLAKQRVAALSVDVAALEAKHPPVIFQLRGFKRGPDGRNLSSEPLAVPLFTIGWDEKPLPDFASERQRPNRPLPARRPGGPVLVEFLGTTRELISLDITDPSVLKRPALQLTNAAELLGPPPGPRQHVENLLGGKEAYETISRPDRVDAWLLTRTNPPMDMSVYPLDVPASTSTIVVVPVPTENSPRPFNEGYVNRAGPVTLKPETARAFSEILTEFKSYFWGSESKMCIVEFGARLRFTRGNDVVDVRLCYQCSEVEFTHGGRSEMQDFDPAHNRLVKALQAAFPADDVVAGLKLTGGGRP